jgi:gas vesicle protein
MDAMKFLVGLLAGLGLGVLVGLLIAPQSGEATRAQLEEEGILSQTSKWYDKIRTRAQNAMLQGHESYNFAKDELSARYPNAKSGEL